MEEKKYFIYSYLFPDNYVYVGLTNNLERRDAEHRKENEHDAVYKHSIEMSIDIPKPVLLESDLNSYMAQSKEENWLEYYRSNGYSILNKHKTGLFASSLGGVNKPLLSNELENDISSIGLSILYEKCYTEAKKYSKLIDFRKNSNYYYNVTCQNKWISKFDWLERTSPVRGYSKDLTLDEIKNIASKYKNKTEFFLNEKTLYLKCLKDGIINDLFEKTYKTKIKDDTSISDDYLISLMSEYSSKTEFAKNNNRLYNISRIRGLLKYFPARKDKPNEVKGLEIDKMLLSDFLKTHKAIKYSSKYPKLVFDVESCSLYHVYTKQIVKMNYSYDRYGILCYKINKRNTCIFDIINDFMFEGKYNFFEVSDFNNIDLKKLIYSTVDLTSFKELKEAKGFFISKTGKIYSSHHKTFLNLGENDGYNVFNGLRIDELVYKYYGEPVSEFKMVNIIHLDGDTRNDSINNLDVELCNRKRNSKFIFMAIFLGNTYEIIVNGKYYLGLIKNEKIIKEIKKEILKKTNKNPNVGSWINSYKKLEFKEWQKKDEEIEMLSLRVKSTGCYYSKVHKLWKSKIFYENKEYSLGYFDNFKCGKILYDEAVVYIKHDMFENWYDSIESHRERVKRLCQNRAK